MATGMTVDTREFDEALRQYAAVSKKDHADIVNHQIRNLAIQALKGTKKAQSSAIRALSGVSWWPKYIAKIISNRGTFFSGTQASRVYQSYWAKGQKKAGRKMTKMETAYQKMARKISSQVLRQRTGAITFLRGFFWKMQQALAPYAPNARATAQPAAIYRNNVATVSPATPERLTATATSKYNYKFRSQKTAAGAERELYKVLAAAYPATAQDMWKYITPRLKATAARFSGRSA